ncbi:MAG: hypothetical protein ACI8PZ_005493 [Myxococcota bacterium]|jgi:hypothetical protein
MVMLLAALALATPPIGLRPVVAPWDAPAQYAAHASAAGRSDALVCEPLWPERAQLCVRMRDGERLRWVTTADLEPWAATPQSLLAAVREAGAEQAVDVEEIVITGMDATYLRVRDGQGWAASVVLDPSAYAERLGGEPIAIAVPTNGVAVAWRAGREPVDRVMAVGVREMFDTLPGAVTPTIFLWSKDGFARFGHAEPVPQ